VPIGTIGGHLAGYGVAGEPAGLSGGHSHLAPAAWLASVAALAALGWVAGARGPRRDRINLAWLAAGQATLFVAVEGAEHVAAGHGLGHLLGDPALRWGLAAQVVTAGALVVAALVARASGERVRALLAGPDAPRGDADEALLRPAAAAAVRTLPAVSSAGPRAPPRSLVSA